jgi:dipeptide/tripeptide permease
MVEVIGSFRFFLLIAGLLLLLVLGSKWIDLVWVAVIAVAWIVLNLIWDGMLVTARRSREERAAWPLQRMRIGEGRYLVFLLLMAGFWTSFNQIFMTLPEYIRDYVDTTDLIATLQPVASVITGVAASLGLDTSSWAKAVLVNGQIKPEHLINLNAFGIICFQVLISFLARNLRPFTTMILGVSITVVSFLLYLAGASGWVVVVAVLVFSVGEMLASPKSKEYAGRIAPPNKVGMYMGYFYWCVALGNLFGGLLSGVSYQYFGPEGVDRPDLMWILFAALATLTAVSLAIYNRWVGRRPAAADAANAG